MFLVYAIKNNKGKIYIGQTSDLNKRLQRHLGILKTKAKSYTYKQKGPWEVVYKEQVATREEARKRERELKSFQGRKFIKGNINSGT
jgi:putative endonuclease